MEPERRSRWRTALLYVACYAIWLVFAAIGIWLIFELRSTLFEVAVGLRANPWVARAIDRFGVVILGLAWLVGIFWLEDSLRRGVEKNRMWQRAARAALVLAVLTGLCFGVRLLV